MSRLEIPYRCGARLVAIKRTRPKVRAAIDRDDMNAPDRLTKIGLRRTPLRN